MRYSRIVLIGFMGSGKSRIGRQLAARLGMRFLDTDAMIEQQEGMSIPAIFEEHGEPYFRQVERRVVEQVAREVNAVVATGGGVVQDPENMKRLKQDAFTVWLQVDPDTVMARTRGGQGRPLLQEPDPRQRILELMAQRESLYRAHADLAVDTAASSPEEVVGRIVEALAGEGHPRRKPGA